MYKPLCVIPAMLFPPPCNLGFSCPLGCLCTLLKCQFLHGISQNLLIRIYVDLSMTPLYPLAHTSLVRFSQTLFNFTFFCPFNEIASCHSMVNAFCLFISTDCMVILGTASLKLDFLPFLGVYRSPIHPFVLLQVLVFLLPSRYILTEY